MSGGRHLFTVHESFTIHHRGVVILPGLVAHSDEVFRVGDPLELRRRDGLVIRTHIAGLPMLSRPPSLTHVPVLLPGELAEDDVPVGTEVWSACADMSAPQTGERAEFRLPERSVTVRDKLNRQIRRFFVFFFTGMTLVALGMLAGAAIGGGGAARWATGALVIAGFALSLGTLFYAFRWGPRCPCCGVSWSFVLNSLGYPYSRLPRLSVPPVFRFCPFCGVPLESACDGGELPQE